MSKQVQTSISIDENVSSVYSAREYAREAFNNSQKIKAEIFGMITATPNDITPIDEEPMDYLQYRLDELWESLWDAFIDNYKYTIIADDAEYNRESQVKKQWEEEIEERKKFEEENNKRINFFKKYKNVLNKYIFDHIRLYNAWKEGEIEIGETLTEEERDKLIDILNKREKKVLEEALKRSKEIDNE